MIKNQKCINFKGFEILRNEIGVAQEEIFGATWNNEEKLVSIKFDIPVFVIFSTDIVNILPKDIENILYIYNESGQLLKEIEAPSVIENGKISKFMYPKIDKTGSLYGFVISQGNEEYELRFKHDELSFSDPIKIRV
jgi:hypothetical protein